MNNNFLFIVIVISSFFFLNVSNSKISIVASVEDKVITNYDVLKEGRYLMILNPNLEKLKKSQIQDLAERSLINEIIKKKEIDKILGSDKGNVSSEKYFQNFFQKLNFESEMQFEKELINQKTYSLDEVLEKIEVELLWNEIVISKYRNQVKIDRKAISDKIKKIKNTKQTEYFLSEIIFKKRSNIQIDDLIKEIQLSIQEIGFNNTATIYSLGNTSKIGGKIGWVNENNLSKNIVDELKKIQENNVSNVIKLGNNYLILKIEEIRENVVEFNEEREIENLILSETNKQLNQFSRILFDKSKINYNINEE